MPYATAYRNCFNGNLWDLHGDYVTKISKSQIKSLLKGVFCDKIYDKGNCYDQILKVLEKFHDPKTGYYGLVKKIRNIISNDKTLVQKYRENSERICARENIAPLKANTRQLEMCKRAVFMIISDLEKSGAINSSNPQLSQAEERILEKSLMERVTDVIEHGSKNLCNDVEYDELRFAFTPAQIQKYHFGNACSHAAAAFVNMNDQIPPEDIKLLISTRWDNMHDGATGHVLPCVKIGSLYYAFEPTIDPAKSEFDFIQPGFPIKAKGQTIFHKLRGHEGVPYIVTTDLIPTDNYAQYLGDFKTFIEKYSKVPKADALVFLENQERLGNLTHEQIERYKKLFDYADGAHLLNNATKKSQHSLVAKAHSAVRNQ